MTKRSAAGRDAMPFAYWLPVPQLHGTNGRRTVWHQRCGSSPSCSNIGEAAGGGLEIRHGRGGSEMRRWRFRERRDTSDLGAATHGQWRHSSPVGAVEVPLRCSGVPDNRVEKSRSRRWRRSPCTHRRGGRGQASSSTKRPTAVAACHGGRPRQTMEGTREAGEEDGSGGDQGQYGKAPR